MTDRVLQPVSKHNHRLSSSSGPGTPQRKPLPGIGHIGTPKIAAFAAAANRLRDLSNNASPRVPSTGANASFAGAPELLVVENSRFEEWMKIATDNKITSTNTWNLALIDYFHDMRLLRNGDGDNSINFQKASCTLDGCVKIWTSRVDSVATETGKLLSGLAEDGAGAGDNGDDEDNSDDDDEAQEARKAKRKTARQAATLADSFDKVKVKAFDLEFTVDPLFKKTSADFDEGGAGGILMNHLGCDGNMKVVFDAGDAKLEQTEAEDEEDAEEEDYVELDLGRLIAKHLPQNVFDSLSTFSLCPSLSSFRFSPDANLNLDILNPIDDVAPVVHPPPPQDAHPDHPANDFDNNMDFGGGGDDDDFGFPPEGNNTGGGQTLGDGSDDFFAGLGGEPSGSGSGAGFGDVRGQFGPGNVSDVTVEMGHAGHLFDDLDAALEKNWAGPEHWKMRRMAVRKEDGAATTAKQRKEKVAFALDFTVPPLIPQKELFAAAPTATSINTPSRKSSLASARSRRSSRITTMEESYTLPNDYHFNSSILLRLFLKPRTTLRMKRRGAMIEENNEPGPEFWAPNDDDDDMGGHDDMGFDLPDAIPFNTQFINDDDMPDLDDEDDEGDLMVATQGQLRRTARIDIGHARKATRVDIKKLKDSIWKELEDVTITVKDLPTSPSYAPTTPSPAAASQEEALVPVIRGLRRAYPPDKMDEISTSFCFICLLHLANENGLRIQTPGVEEGVDDGLLPRRTVGGLDRLRVFRALTAERCEGWEAVLGGGEWVI